MYKRIANRGHEICFEGEVYLIDPSDTGNLWRKEFVLHRYQDNTLAFFHAEKRLPFDRRRKTVRNCQKGA